MLNKDTFEELKMKHLSDEELGNLKLYGKVLEGINREILVPGDITLHALHYVIQRAFGWQNSHLHNFKLPEDAFQKLTGGKNTADKYGVYNYDGKFTDWINMCGVYFRYPTENYDDIYWDDDYVEGHSFKSWLRRKYVGPYNYDGEWEHYQKANSAARYMMKRYPMIDVSSYIHTSQMNINKLETIDKSKTTIPIAEATIEDVQYGFMYRLDELLERIPVANILTLQGVDIDDEIYSRVVDLCNKRKKSFEELPVFPVTDELIYTYDYGDCWEVSIKMTEFYYTKDSWTMMEDTKQDGYFIPPVKENNVIDDQLVYNLKEEYLGKELSREIAIVAIKKKPVCVALDGLSVMDDVGGVHGYIDFLKESRLGDAVQKEELKAWARFMGWTGKMSKPDKLL